MKITIKQLKVIKLLAYTELPKEKIARISGINNRTIDSWLRDPLFLSILHSFSSSYETAYADFLEHRDVEKFLSRLELTENDYIIVSEIVEVKLKGIADADYSERYSVIFNKLIEMIDKKADIGIINSGILVAYFDNYFNFKSSENYRNAK